MLAAVLDGLNGNARRHAAFLAFVLASALDSLRNWKYEPGYLDDKPVAVKTSVIVKFRLR